MIEPLRVAFSPPAEADKNDHGLVFTDILFGFVIYELFTSQPTSLDEWLHLALAGSLVLGSWIGFRRSKNRHQLALKFVNLPLLRFLADQAMVFTYFVIARLTKADASGNPPATDLLLLQKTLGYVTWVFVLYLTWDLLGVAISRVRKYRELKGTQVKTDFVGLAITAAHLAILGLLYNCVRIDGLKRPATILCWIIGIIALLTYRWAKEVRSSCRAN